MALSKKDITQVVSAFLAENPKFLLVVEGFELPLAGINFFINDETHAVTMVPARSDVVITDADRNRFYQMLNDKEKETAT